MRIFKIHLTLSIILFLAPSFTAASRPFEEDGHCITEALGRFYRTEDRMMRANVIHHMLERVRNGSCPLDQTMAKDLSFFLLKIATEDKDPVVRMEAGQFLRANPHRGLSLQIIQVLEQGQIEDQATRDLYIDILANLRDRRVEPLLLERLRTGHHHLFLDTMAALAEMGTSQTIEELQALYDDPRSGVKPDLRARIPATIREIRLRMDADFYSPFPLVEPAVSQLKANGFAVTFEQKNEMFEFYDGDFPYVTTDVVFHTAMILVRAALEGLEQQGMRQELGAFCAGMTNGCLDQAARLSGHPDLAEMALNNAAFFAVPARLCLGDSDSGGTMTSLPAELIGRVDTELVLIRAEAGVSFSPVLGGLEDFARYRPRGRFAGQGQTVADYARAVTWLGRTSFALREDDPTRRALLLVEVLEKQPELLGMWEDLDALMTLLFGRQDDGSFSLYKAAAARVGHSILELLEDPAGLDRFRAEITLPRQAINTAYLPWPASGQWQERTSGLRVLGQRYTPDSHIFQELMDDGQWPVSGLHVVAGIMESSRAAAILDEAGFKASPRGINLPDPPTGLVEQAIVCLRTLFQTESSADNIYRSDAWQDKQINTALGGWAEIRHATAPYVKDATMYLGISALNDRIHGYVEPYPEFYQHLKSMAANLNEVLISRGVYSRMTAAHSDSALILEHEKAPGKGKTNYRASSLDNDRIHLDSEHLPKFMVFLDHLTDLSRKELAGENQTVADGQFFKRVGRTIQSLSLNKASSLVAREPMSRVIDVATEYQSGTCLEVAVSRPMAIYVVVSHQGERVVCRGAVYNYHEFTWPAQDRLTDQQWRALDNRLDLKNRPPWLSTRRSFRLPRPVKKEELKDLEQSRSEPKKKWHKVFQKNPTRWNGACHLTDATADTSDVTQLIHLAELDPGNPGVCMFAHDRLLAMNDHPAVRDFFERLTEASLARGKIGAEACWVNMTSLYRHLALQGTGGLDDLESLKVRQFRQLSYLGFPDLNMPQPLQTHLDLALIQARSNQPARWVWGLQ
jgi:hypothetical protein